jgi:uncharacterized protein (TIGR02646 family)
LERVVLKQIFKTKEPISLTNYRASISKEDLNSLEKFDTAPSNVKDELREKLLEEQGFICCYCMDRVSSCNSKIEHFKPRSLFRGEQLDYANLFVACLGGQGCSPKKQSCDTKKGNNVLRYINLLSNIEESIEYKKDGSIFSNNQDIDNELTQILNLNHKLLKNNRQEALNQLLTDLKKRGWNISTLKSTLKKYKYKNSKGKYRLYCEMIVYFLTKKLKQKGVTP